MNCPPLDYCSTGFSIGQELDFTPDGKRQFGRRKIHTPLIVRAIRYEQAFGGFMLRIIGDNNWWAAGWFQLKQNNSAEIDFQI